VEAYDYNHYFELVEEAPMTCKCKDVKDLSLEELARELVRANQIRNQALSSFKDDYLAEGVEWRSSSTTGWVQNPTLIHAHGEYRAVKAPTFKPFTVGDGWEVKLEEDVLLVGCESFPSAWAKKALSHLTRSSSTKYTRSGDRDHWGKLELFARRDGVHHTGGIISWTEADKILKALEEAGI
jgi:hypothetical protein